MEQGGRKVAVPGGIGPIWHLVPFATQPLCGAADAHKAATKSMASVVIDFMAQSGEGESRLGGR